MKLREFQMVNGGLCIFFNAAIFIFMAASRDWLFESQQTGGGIWGGVLYIISGAFLFVCSKRQSFCMGVTALTLNALFIIANLVHVMYMSTSVMSEERRSFAHSWWDGNEDHHVYWRKPVYVVLFR